MIIEIEDKNGNTIGGVHLYENNDPDCGVSIKGVCGDLSIADIDLDDLFDTNEEKVRIQLS